MVTDRTFLADNVRAVALQARVTSKVYVYLFNYRGSRSSSDSITKTRINYGELRITNNLSKGFQLIEIICFQGLLILMMYIIISMYQAMSQLKRMQLILK